MSDPELRAILKAVDDAMEVYRKHEGRLMALDISVKSMLVTVRDQIVAQLAQQRVRATEKE